MKHTHTHSLLHTHTHTHLHTHTLAHIHYEKHKVQISGATYLHPTDAHADGGGGCLLALPHLPHSLLLAGVVPVLACAHLQVEDARQLKVRRQVLKQDEF